MIELSTEVKHFFHFLYVGTHFMCPDGPQCFIEISPVVQFTVQFSHRSGKAVNNIVQPTELLILCDGHRTHSHFSLFPSS